MFKLIPRLLLVVTFVQLTYGFDLHQLLSQFSGAGHHQQSQSQGPPQTLYRLIIPGSLNGPNQLPTGNGVTFYQLPANMFQPQVTGQQQQAYQLFPANQFGGGGQSFSSGSGGGLFPFPYQSLFG